MRSSMIFSVLISGLLCSVPAVAQKSPEWTRCEGGSGITADQQIDACTSIIKSASEPPQRLATAYLKRGVAMHAKDKYDEAIADYDQAIRLDPANDAAWNNRCYSRAIIGQLKEALTDCNESLRLNPNEAETLDSRGFTYLKLGQLDLAINDYNAALKVEPQSADSLFGRGVARLRKGDTASGAADIAAAKAIQNDIEEEFRRYGVTRP